jgi:trypsin
MRAMNRSLWWGGSLLIVGCSSPTIGGEDGQTHSEIIGGTTAAITDHPWQVLLETHVPTSAPDSYYLERCGGTIITPNWVMTAQHCVRNLDNGSFLQPFASPRLMLLTAGTADLTNLTDAQQRTAIEYVIAPGYTGDPAGGADVALVRVYPAFTLNGSNVNSIKLLSVADEASGFANPGVLATATGWGLTSNGGSVTNLLQELDMPLVSSADASAELAVPVLDDMIAAGTLLGTSGTCNGDSGGPLVVDRNGEPRLAGITSWGIGSDGAPCANAGYPDVFARASAFLGWTKTIRATTRTKVFDALAPSRSAGQAISGSFDVPAGAVSMDVIVRGGTGDYDLYVKFGSAPTSSVFDCSSTSWGNEEYCPIANPSAGKWYVTLVAYTSSSGAELVAQYRLPK